MQKYKVMHASFFQMHLTLKFINYGVGFSGSSDSMCTVGGGDDGGGDVGGGVVEGGVPVLANLPSIFFFRLSKLSFKLSDGARKSHADTKTPIAASAAI